MTGMDIATGAHLSGLDHIRQSVRDILTTPIGTRVMRRDYGSALLPLLDLPLVPATMVRIVAAAADALATWEPRIRVRQIETALGDRPGHLFLTIRADLVETGEAVVIEDLGL